MNDRMAYVQPSTNIVLIKNCILQKSVNDETDTLYFAKESEQTAYFNGLGNKVEYSPTTYQNMGQGVMRIGKTMKELYGCNYMYFTNKNEVTIGNNTYTNDVFENKRYYCFIDGLKYINNNCTEVYYSIDYIQTFMFDYDEKTCLVERMTTADDEIGKYLLDEGLDLGRELVVSSCNRKQFDGDWYYAIIFASKVSFISDGIWDMQRKPITDMMGILMGEQTLGPDVTGFTVPVATAEEFWVLEFEDIPTQLDGKMKVPLYANTGVTIYPVVNVEGTAGYYEPVIDTTKGISHDFSTSNEYMTKLYGTESAFSNEDYTRLLNSIIDVALFPNFFTTGEGGSGVSYSGMGAIHSATDFVLTYPSALNGYTPKNKKLLTFPYISLTVSNPNGDNMNLRYELFTNKDSIKFALECTVLPSVQCLLSPVNYSGYLGHIVQDAQQQSDYVARDIGLVITDFPKVPIYTDSYRQYLAKNKYRDMFSIVNAIGASAIGTASALVTGGATALQLAGNFSGLYEKSTNLISKHYEASLQPPGLVGQMGTSDIKLGKSMFGYTFLGMSIDYEHAKVIDDYFTRYGYKLARNIKPSRKNRTNFTYIKTIECNLAINQHGDTFTGFTMSQEDEKAIETIYNNGVRFWYGTDGNGRRYYKDYSVPNEIVNGG